VSTDSSSLWPMRVAKPMGNDCRNERLLARRPDDPHTFRLRMDSLAGGMCREQYGIDRVAGHELLSLLRQGDCFFVEFRGLGLRQKRPDPLEMTELPAPFPLPPGERRVESRRGVPSRGRRAKKRDLGQVVEHEEQLEPRFQESLGSYAVRQGKERQVVRCRTPLQGGADLVELIHPSGEGPLAVTIRFGLLGEGRVLHQSTGEPK